MNRLGRPNKTGYDWNSDGKKLATRDKKRRLLEMFGGRCVDCGFDGHPAALDFDHINPSVKAGNVAHLSWSKAVLEATQCEIRCSNCHRIKTSVMEQWGRRNR